MPSRWARVAVGLALVGAGACSSDDDGAGGGTAAEGGTTTSPPTAVVVDDPLPEIVAMDAAGALAIEAGTDADWVTVAQGVAWVANVGGGVRRYDATTAAEIGTTPVPGFICLAMEVGFESLWAGDCDSTTVVRIDLATGAVVATIDPGVDAPAGESSIAVDDSGVYLLSDATPRQVVRIDPTDNTAEVAFPAPERAAGVRAGFGALWFSQPGDAALVGVDPTDGTELSSAPAGRGARFLTAGEDAMWVMNNGDGTVTRVSPDGEAVATITVADGPVEGGDIAFGAGYVWARVSDAVVAQIDPATNGVVARFGTPAGSGSVGAEGGAAWISAHDVATVWRLPVA